MGTFTQDSFTVFVSHRMKESPVAPASKKQALSQRTVQASQRDAQELSQRDSRAVTKGLARNIGMLWNCHNGNCGFVTNGLARNI